MTTGHASQTATLLGRSSTHDGAAHRATAARPVVAGHSIDHTRRAIDGVLPPETIELCAVMAEGVATHTSPALICGNVATRGARAVVVVAAVRGRFLDLIHGVEGGSSWHRKHSLIAAQSRRHPHCTRGCFMLDVTVTSALSHLPQERSPGSVYATNLARVDASLLSRPQVLSPRPFPSLVASAPTRHSSAPGPTARRRTRELRSGRCQGATPEEGSNGRHVEPSDDPHVHDDTDDSDRL
jgi:hypothetical protein